MGWGPLGDIVDGARHVAGDVVGAVEHGASAAVDWTQHHWKQIASVAAGAIVTAGILALVVTLGGTIAPFVLAGAAALLLAGAVGGLTSYAVSSWLEGTPFTARGALYSALTGAVLTWATPAAGTVVAPVVERVAGTTAANVIRTVTGAGAGVRPNAGELGDAGAAAAHEIPVPTAPRVEPARPPVEPVPEPRTLVEDPATPPPTAGGDVVPETVAPPPPSGGKGILGRLDGEPPPVSSGGAGSVAAHGSAEEAQLVQALEQQGVKVSPDKVVRAGTTRDGRIVFLEEGTTSATSSRPAGLGHILEAHGADFERIGVPAEQVPDFVTDAVTRGRLVGYQGTGTGRPVYEVTWNGEPRTVAVTVGSNGYIVGANPTSSFRPTP